VRRDRGIEVCYTVLWLTVTQTRSRPPRSNSASVVTFVPGAAALLPTASLVSAHDGARRQRGVAVPEGPDRPGSGARGPPGGGNVLIVSTLAGTESALPCSVDARVQCGTSGGPGSGRKLDFKRPGLWRREQRVKCAVKAPDVSAAFRFDPRPTCPARSPWQSACSGRMGRRSRKHEGPHTIGGEGLRHRAWGVAPPCSAPPSGRVRNG